VVTLSESRGERAERDRPGRECIPKSREQKRELRKKGLCLRKQQEADDREWTACSRGQREKKKEGENGQQTIEIRE
jgi:hypothetical protein